MEFKLSHKETDGKIIVILQADNLIIQHSLESAEYRHEAEAIATGLGAIAYFNQSLFEMHCNFVEAEIESPHSIGWKKITLLQGTEDKNPRLWEAQCDGQRAVGGTFKEAIGFLLLFVNNRRRVQLELTEEVEAAITNYHYSSDKFLGGEYKL